MIEQLTYVRSTPNPTYERAGGAGGAAVRACLHASASPRFILFSFPPTMKPKSTPEQIRQRFDNDVERFSNLETGQSATIDAPLVLDLIAEAAAATTPGARAVLDVGC